ncbi:nuclear transport factor 2 family protein [Rhodoplanes sp. SY1]|uniref:nuclear transport factor 2 family protein n=1 Tax=Rhodoplanes sp. SY1 TaxID=3166646 RepID=UPI0038B69ADB
MPLVLAPPVAAYFAAARRGADIGPCFGETAVVVDERATHAGRAAIRRWHDAATATYRHVAEPLAVAEAEGRTVVTARVTGAFPGSPIDLRYAFVLDRDTIARLEIAP